MAARHASGAIAARSLTRSAGSRAAASFAACGPDGRIPCSDGARGARPRHSTDASRAAPSRGARPARRAGSRLRGHGWHRDASARRAGVQHRARCARRRSEGARGLPHRRPAAPRPRPRWPSRPRAARRRRCSHAWAGSAPVSDTRARGRLPRPASTPSRFRRPTARAASCGGRRGCRAGRACRCSPRRRPHRPGAFPVAGAYSLGGPEMRFGAGRPGPLPPGSGHQRRRRDAGGRAGRGRRPLGRLPGRRRRPLRRRARRGRPRLRLHAPPGGLRRRRQGAGARAGQPFAAVGIHGPLVRPAPALRDLARRVVFVRRVAPIDPLPDLLAWAGTR